MVCLASWSVNFFLKLYLKEKRREEKTRGEDIREEKRREENKTGGKKGSVGEWSGEERSVHIPLKVLPF